MKTKYKCGCSARSGVPGPHAPCNSWGWAGLPREVLLQPLTPACWKHPSFPEARGGSLGSLASCPQPPTLRAETLLPAWARAARACGGLYCQLGAVHWVTGQPSLAGSLPSHLCQPICLPSWESGTKGHGPRLLWTLRPCRSGSSQQPHPAQVWTDPQGRREVGTRRWAQGSPDTALQGPDGGPSCLWPATQGAWPPLQPRWRRGRGPPRRRPLYFSSVGVAGPGLPRAGGLARSGHWADRASLTRAAWPS